ncbi:MAG TPA: hypothetical protein VEC35_20725 [Noviherbaspirillum sp.]|nr:hypothetical protein [Noviherbaspirillum sp.]
MTKKVALLTLHGMGEVDYDYYKGLHKQLSGRPDVYMDRVAFQAVNYQTILQPNQDTVWANMLLKAEALEYHALRQFLLFGISDAAGLENRYDEPGSAYEDAQLEIARKLYAVRSEMEGDGAVVAIAQSLGGQLLSCYLYDAQKAASSGRASGIWRDIDAFAPRITGHPHRLTPEEKRFLAGGRTAGIVTTGCNIPIFVAAHKKMDVRPIMPPSIGFRWLNFYDRHDPLGWPLQPLGGGYEMLVEDREINASRGLQDWLKSFTPMSHLAYWEDDNVVDALAGMLAEAMQHH